MDSGRIPACNTLPLAGDDIAGGLDVLIGRNSNDYYPSMQESHIKKGNRCDHDKNNLKKPKFDGSSKRRPHAIEEAKRRLFQSCMDIYQFPEFTEIFYHPIKDGQGRRRRSEGVENCISLCLTTLLHTLNLQKMACGHYDSANTFHYYNYAYIENQTDQNAWRIKRGMTVLQQYGYVKVIAIKEQNNDGSWRTPVVKIEFTDKIFQALELMPEFLKDRETIAIKFHEKQSRLDKNRQKKENFRKPFFSSTIKKAKKEVGAIEGLAKRIGKPIPKASSGRGYQIKARMEQLKYQGISPQQIIEILKQEFPPPS